MTNRNSTRETGRCNSEYQQCGSTIKEIKNRKSFGRRAGNVIQGIGSEDRTDFYSATSRSVSLNMAFSLILMFFFYAGHSQTGLELRTDGLVLPHVNSDSIINSVKGQVVFDTLIDALKYHDGAAWKQIGNQDEEEAVGMLLPQFTDADRDTISNPQLGLMIFNTDSDCAEVYRSSGWYNLCDGGSYIPSPFELLIGGSLTETFSDMKETSDGGYIIAGFSRSSQSGDVSAINKGDSDYWIVKISAAGQILWEKSFGGNLDDEAQSVVETSDGGFAIIGESYTSQNGDVTGTNNGDRDLWLIKLDANGNLLWESLLGGTQDDFAKSISATCDGGVVVVGNVPNSDGDISGSYKGGLTDTWLIKFDPAGGVEWQKLIGGDAADYGISIKSTADCGYIMGGYTSTSANGDVTGVNQGGVGDYWLVRMNSSGNIIWDSLYGGIGNDYITDLQITDDGGYIAVGITNNASGDVTGPYNGGTADSWVIKVDAFGTLIWETILGGGNVDEGHSVVQASDGGYTIAGHSGSAGNGFTDYWIYKLGVNGGFVWEKYIGGNEQDEADTILKFGSSGYIVGGFSRNSEDGDVTQVNNGQADHWIITIDAVGNLTN